MLQTMALLGPAGLAALGDNRLQRAIERAEKDYCVVCGKGIPQGRAGRTCKDCRKTDSSQKR